MIKIYALLFVTFIFFLNGCKKNEESSNRNSTTSTPKNLIELIKKQGYSINGIMPYQDGYIVEGDIIIREADLTSTDARNVAPTNSNGRYQKSIITGTIAQYQTTHIVKNASPSTWRTIKVSLDVNSPSSYFTALDAALARYNNAGISLSFQRVTENADIAIRIDNNLPSNVYGGSEGFPSSEGNPNPRIWINALLLGNNPHQGFLTTFFAHEIGHCIGFRHTDYFDRSFSYCPYNSSLPDGYNEGAGSVGAIHIPGTPNTGDTESWMLACTNEVTDRPFNANDIIALRYLYPGFAITGSNTICSAESYTINNLPAGANVAWSSSASGAATLSTNGNVATLTSTEQGGQTVLIATITSTTLGTIQLTKTVTCNAPLSSQYSNCYSIVGASGPAQCFSNSVAINDDASIVFNQYIDPYVYGDYITVSNSNVLSMSMQVTSKTPSNAIVYVQPISSTQYKIGLKGYNTSARILVTYHGNCGDRVTNSVYVRAPGGAPLPPILEIE